MLSQKQLHVGLNDHGVCWNVLQFDKKKIELKFVPRDVVDTKKTALV